MEAVDAEVRDFLNKESEGITPAWVKATQNIGGLLVMDVGPRGGGKTTKASWLVQFYKEYEPDIRRVTNVPIEDAYYVPDILKFLATKLKLEGKEKAYEIKGDGTVRILPRTQIPARMLTIVDESAISGLEARGSGLVALNSYLLALSRKLNVDCELISQMMCLAKGTLIETPSGMTPIEQIGVGDAVVDNTYWGKRVKRVGATKKQIQPKILRVELESGHSIRATPNHRFPVYRYRQERNDIPASDLMVGDMLKIDRWRLKRTSFPLYQLLGLIHAEGSWRTTKGMKETNQLSVTLDKREAELQRFVMDTIRSFFPETHFSIRSDETNRFVITLSRKKEVRFLKRKYEDFLHSGGKSRTQKASFLSGFFEGDGCVELKTYTITLCQSESNRDKLEVAMESLRDLGIPFHLYTDWRKVGGAAAQYARQEGYVVNRLKIGCAYNAIFANTVGFISSVKQGKLESMLSNYYARISAITEINEPTEVYDLSIEKGAPYFMANGIRSHNSMVEKRGQWLSDFYWLCEPRFVTGSKILDYFRYRIYDEGYRKMNEYHLSREDAAAALFGKFDSWDMPNYDALAEAFTIHYNITDEDVAFYNDIRDGKKHIPKQPESSNVIEILEKKWLRSPSGRYPGDTFLMGAKRFEVLQRDWDFDKGAYRYKAREIPNSAFIEDADMVAEVAA
jgi:hypothetical protein